MLSLRHRNRCYCLWLSVTRKGRLEERHLLKPEDVRARLQIYFGSISKSVSFLRPAESGRQGNKVPRDCELGLTKVKLMVQGGSRWREMDGRYIAGRRKAIVGSEPLAAGA